MYLVGQEVLSSSDATNNTGDINPGALICLDLALRAICAEELVYECRERRK